MAITQRDKQVLVDVFLQRAATRRQLQLMGHFRSTSVANSRLRKLFDAGYLRRAFVASGAYATEAVYIVGPAARNELLSLLEMSHAEVTRLTKQAAPSFLSHALCVTEARIAFTHNISPADFQVQWLSEPECRHEYRTQTEAGLARHILKPDGGLLIQTGAIRHLFFIELDRGHVSLPQFAKSCASYNAYLTRRLPSQVYGVENASVLCITTAGQRRIDHLARVARLNGLQVCFCQFSQLCASNPYGPIWQIEGEPGHCLLPLGAMP